MSQSSKDREARLDPSIAARLKKDAKGLVAAVVQQYDSRQVLMVGYMDEEALRRTLTTGRVTSRQSASTATGTRCLSK